jgi:hypothetical protein
LLLEPHCWQNSHSVRIFSSQRYADFLDVIFVPITFPGSVFEKRNALRDGITLMHKMFPSQEEYPFWIYTIFLKNTLFSSFLHL